MKRTTTLALGAALAVIGATGLAVASFADGDRGGYGYGGHHGYGMGYGMHGGGYGPGMHHDSGYGPGMYGGGPGGPRMFEQFDLDKDGKLTQAEIDTARAERLAKFDANGDGALNLEEYQALWIDAMRERMVDRFQAHDDDGDGKVTKEEFAERFAGMVARMDTNGDGVIDREDMQRRWRDRDGD